MNMHDHHHSGTGSCSCAHDHAGPGEAAFARDPVCGMTVDPDAGKPSLDYQGRTYHFCCDGCRKKFEASPQDYLTAKDPVCGMSVDRSTARHFLKHEGEKFYFCSAGCKAKFEADPQAYRDGNRPAPTPMPKGTQYTCPMHPEVISDHPGDCPKCGMALEPMGIPPADEGPNPELVDFTRRLWISAALAIPLLVLSMGPMIGLPLRDAIGEPLASWIELLLATPVVLWAALPFFRRALASLRQPQPEHVDADRPRRRHGLYLQCGRNACARALSDEFPGPWRNGARLFRGRSRHRGTRLRRSGAGAEGARTDRFSHPGIARPRAKDGAPHQRRRQRDGCRGGRHRRRRPAAGAAGRARAGRRIGQRRAIDRR